MILSDVDLKKALVSKELVIANLRGRAIQPASIDLHLGGDFIEFTSKKTVDIFDIESGYTKSSVTDTFIIPSRAFILATTDEVVEISNSLVAFVEGRSSIGRKGLFIHNAGYIDPCFKGAITLELFNASPRPIILHRGMSICQLVVARLTSLVQKGYDGKYQNQETVTESRFFQEIFKPHLKFTGGDINGIKS